VIGNGGLGRDLACAHSASERKKRATVLIIDLKRDFQLPKDRMKFKTEISRHFTRNPDYRVAPVLST
jgi:hypothetical protein